MLKTAFSSLYSHSLPANVAWMSLNLTKLGSLSMTIEGIKERDKTVLNLAQSLNIPIMCCMGGGIQSG